MGDYVELTVSTDQKRPGPVRLVATLGVAGMLSGLILAGAYQATEGQIRANHQARLRENVYVVVPGSSAMQRLALRDGALVPITESEDTDDPTIYAAYDDAGAFLGYAIIGQGAGFQDTIRLLYGYDPGSRRTIGMRVLESRETPGLGDKIYKDKAFVHSFDALGIDPEVVVVTDGKDADNEVDAITGATISSKAVVRIINEANVRWLGVLPAPGSEPPLERAPADEESEEAP